MVDKIYQSKQKVVQVIAFKMGTNKMGREKKKKKWTEIKCVLLWQRNYDIMSDARARAAHSEEVDRPEYELLWFTHARIAFTFCFSTQNTYTHEQRQLHAIATSNKK